MTPARFSECLLHIRWTPINIASARQCELSWIEAMEAGNEEVPAGLAAWLETLAQAHEALPPPTTYHARPEHSPSSAVRHSGYARGEVISPQIPVDEPQRSGSPA